MTNPNQMGFFDNIHPVRALNPIYLQALSTLFAPTGSIHARSSREHMLIRTRIDEFSSFCLPSLYKLFEKIEGKKWRGRMGRVSILLSIGWITDPYQALLLLKHRYKFTALFSSDFFFTLFRFLRAQIFFIEAVVTVKVFVISLGKLLRFPSLFL